MSGQLVRYDAMRTAITAAHSIDEVKDIRDKALAIELYARQATDMQLERQVHDIRVRAERRCGELLRATPKANGAREPGTNRGATRSEDTRASTPKTLREIGISYNQSSEWQQLADVPEKEFEEELANPVALPTAAGIIAVHKARNRPETPPAKPVDDRALWLFGALLGFKRQGILSTDPEQLFETMTGEMKQETREFAPVVTEWLGRLPR